MQKRTTISLNQDYLDSLKIIAVKHNTSLSKLVNEAVRNYLSKMRKTKNNYAFFNQLDQIKEDVVGDEEKLNEYIKKGRM